MTEGKAAGTAGGPAWIGTGRDLLALLRDGALVLIFLMLLLIPGVIGERASAAPASKRAA